MECIQEKINLLPVHHQANLVMKRSGQKDIYHFTCLDPHAYMRMREYIGKMKGVVGSDRTKFRDAVP